MKRLPNSYHVPGVIPHMEYLYADNRSLPLISRHPTEQMFRSFIEAPGYDLNNTMQYACDSSRALPMIASPEPSSRSTLLFDMMQASQQRALLNSGSYWPSEYSGLATSSKSFDAFHDFRSAEEVDSLSRRPIHGFEDGLSCSTPSSVRILRPIRDGEVTFAGVTASKVVDDHGIPHPNQKDLESAQVAGLEMEKVLRNYFQDASERSFHPSTFTRSFSTHNPASTERRELQAPPLVGSTSSPSSQAECNMSSGTFQSGLPDRLASLAAHSKFALSRPTFKRLPEGMGTAEFNAIRKGKQQIPSAGGDGVSQGPSPLPCATASEGFKSTQTRPSTMTIDGSEWSRPKRRRTRGDSTGETQRMTHRAAERNRRNQMNDHICTLRDLMPSNFLQKTDQTSIIGATVEYLKQLEVTLESLQSIHRSRRPMAAILNPSWNRFNTQTRSAPPAAASDTVVAGCRVPSLLSATPTSEDAVHRLQSRRPTMSSELFSNPEDSRVTSEVDKVECRSAGAKVEVRFLEGDAIVNISTPWREKQIVTVIVAIESLDLTILHSSVDTFNNTVLYAFCATVGPQCRMTANEIAAALQQIFNSEVVNCIYPNCA